MDMDDEIPQLVEVDELVDTNLDTDGVPDLEPVSAPAKGPSPSRFERDKVPLTLLTGYLGAGKSTLLQYIMTANHGYRIAVCMNDFGDTTDIEGKTLQLSDPNSTDPSATTTEILSLPNGCLCCSVKDLGIAAIEDMVAAQRDRVDWVMVELTGLADPAPIAKSFWANEEMGDLVLDAVVCVVDSRNILKQLSEQRPDGTPNEAEKQIACADVILLNKGDLVDPARLDDVQRVVGEINPTLRVHRTVRSQMPLDGMFDLKAYTSSAAMRVPEPSGDACCNGTDSTTCHDLDHSHDHSPDGSHDNSTHSHHTVQTVSIPLPTLKPSQWSKLNDFLEQLLWESTVPVPAGGASWVGESPDVLRTKGYVKLTDGGARVIQGVADLFEATDVPAEGEGEGDVQTKIVFIGRRVQGLAAAVRAYVFAE